MTQIDELDKILEKHQLEPGELTYGLKEDLQNYIATQIQQAYDRGYADKAIRAEQSLIDQIQMARLDELERTAKYAGAWFRGDERLVNWVNMEVITDRIAQLRSKE